LLADNILFGEGNGWTISTFSTENSALCSANKKFDKVDVTLSELKNESGNDTLLTISVRPHQKIPNRSLRVRFGSHEIELSRNQAFLTNNEVSLLIRSAELSLANIGLAKTLSVELSPHTRIQFNAPQYAMYLLGECSMGLEGQAFLAGTNAALYERFPKFIKEALPDEFRSFVRAFTMVEEDAIKFLNLEEARKKYADWVMDGWTGDKLFSYGVGYRVIRPIEDVVTLFNKKNREACDKNNGEWNQYSGGQVMKDEITANINYAFCKIPQKTWHRSYMIAIKNTQIPTYGLIESRFHKSSQLEELSQRLEQQSVK
jgi:hypothetical protein